MNERITNWLYRKGFMTVSEHEEVLQYKNQTIQSAVHMLIEQERELTALRGLMARYLVEGS
jgi:hypothetical protein